MSEDERYRKVKNNSIRHHNHDQEVEKVGKEVKYFKLWMGT